MGHRAFDVSWVACAALAGALLVLAACPGSDPEVPEEVPDAGVPGEGPDAGVAADAGPRFPLTCDECASAGFCLADISKRCTPRGACVSEMVVADVDAGGGDLMTCFADGMRTRTLAASKVPWGSTEVTYYEPDGDVCYRVLAWRHWRLPRDLPPGDPYETMTFYFPDGGTADITRTASGRVSFGCQRGPPPPPGCSLCLPSFPYFPGCDAGTCQQP